MTPENTDDARAHVQSHLTRVEELITGAEARLIEHAAHLAKLESASPELQAISRQVQRNLEEGLRLLLHQRSILTRELAYLERRINQA